MKIYNLNKNVLEAARERVSLIFDNFKDISVSVSSGKDSILEDSIIYVQIDGTVYRTTPLKLLGLIKEKKSWTDKDGRVFIVPEEKVNILDADSKCRLHAKVSFSPVNYIMYHFTDKDIYDIVSTCNRRIQVTGDHSVMIGKNNGYDIKPFPASSLRVGDFLIASITSGFDSVETNIPDWLLYLGGLWLADGCYALNRKMIISTGHFKPIIEFLKNLPRPEEKMDLVSKELDNLIPMNLRGKGSKWGSVSKMLRNIAKKYGVSYSSVHNVYYFGNMDRGKFLYCKINKKGDAWICNKSLVERMKSLGFTGLCKEKKIPDWVYSMSKRQIGIFLAGFFDGDGCVQPKSIACSGVNKNLLMGIKELLWRLGIPSGWSELKGEIGGFNTASKVLYVINIGSSTGVTKFKKYVPLLKDVNKCIVKIKSRENTTDFVTSTIKEINILPKKTRRVFDFEVNNTHTFIANSLLVHNSSVCYNLFLQEAVKRKRKITAFFQDQEAEYQSSIDLIQQMMQHPNVIPAWYQVPIYLTNATSYTDYFLYAWGEGEQWIREKDPLAIHEIKEEYPKRFYEFFKWYEKKDKNAAYIVGLRAEEGITRYRAVTKFPGWRGLKWSTISDGVNKFYPIYDWTIYDVWKFLYDFSISYNKVYDLMYMNNYSLYTKMRVSNLIHEKSYKCLVDLPNYEPETYFKLCKRIGGIATASRYASEKLVFSNKKLPTHYKTWQEFRDFLLNNIPNEDQRAQFTKRFEKQTKTENTYQKQVGQLLILDFENSRSFDTKKSEKIEREKQKWLTLL
jgi:predicted phosphoadenosine phosphosulfate sulfurtransferase